MATTTFDTPLLENESIGAVLTPRQLIWRRFRKHRMALLGVIGFSILLLFIIIGSFFVSEEKANAVELGGRLSPPSQEHWMGTDSTGRDIFARIIHGGQISLVVGVLSVLISVGLGTVIGGIAAYYGGWVDSLLMRFTEAMLSIPSLFLLIVLGKFLGRDIQTFTILGRTFSGSVAIVIFVIGLTSWMYLARIVRANVLSLREMDYISVSRSLGASDVRIFFQHLIPNTMGAIIVSSTLGLAGETIMAPIVLGIRCWKKNGSHYRFVHPGSGWTKRK